ncbi:MAG: S41 family peptidase [Bacteroidota bacterium]|nr:S41 family peptidase [Bacteroidota bacterium]
MVFKKILFIVVGVLLFYSCKKSDNSSPTPANSEVGKLPVLYQDTLERQYSSFNEAIYYIFRDVYYWNSNTPKGYDYNKFSDPQDLVDDLKKKPEDRFTFIADKQTTEQYFNSGTSFDPGFVVGRDDSSTVALFYVEPNSAAAKAGLYRGERIIKIGGKDIETAIKDQSYATIMSQSTIQLELKDTANKTVTATVSGISYTSQTVLHKSIINRGSKKIGYLVFNSFIETSEQELTNAFAYFKSNGINELIVDLRYNGGGILDIAVQLSSLIAGNKGKGKDLYRMKYNQDYQSENTSIKFNDSIPNTLNINRVFFIASKYTASASEAVINGLYPAFGRENVFIIGNKTYGKPYASIPLGYQNYLIFPIVLSIFNGNDEGNYSSGLSPNAYRYDIVRYDWGDTRDNCLKEAVNYISTGQFSGTIMREEFIDQSHTFIYPKPRSVLILNK